MELEAVTGKGLWGHKGPGSRLACSLYLRCWIEQLSACQLADRLMRTLSHSTQWWKGPYCLTSLIVEPAHISEPACWGLGLFFFFWPPPPHTHTHIQHPSLFLNFFLFLYFILYPAHCLTPLTRAPLLCTIFPQLAPLARRHHSLPHSLSLPPSVSHFSLKWWVLTYDRLSQVCFNYCKGDGDGTGEEDQSEGGWGTKRKKKKNNFCAHIIFKKWRIKCYLHHGGFFCRSPPDQPCRCRGTSHDMRVAQFTSLVRESNLGRREIIMWVSKLVWGKVAAAFDIQYFNFMWSSWLHFATAH